MSLLQQIWTSLKRWAAAAWERISAFASEVWHRHSQRLEGDRDYRHSLATALAALAGTVFANPSLTAAVNVLLTHHLSSPRPSLLDDEDDPTSAGLRVRPIVGRCGTQASDWTSSHLVRLPAGHRATSSHNRTAEPFEP